MSNPSKAKRRQMREAAANPSPPLTPGVIGTTNCVRPDPNKTVNRPPRRDTHKRPPRS